jgi:hypothetical protein
MLLTNLFESALRDKEDLQAKRKAIQDIQMDPNTHKDPELKKELARRKADLEKEAKKKGLAESAENLNIGDDVIITGNVQYNGATGVIKDFGRDNRFVIVDLYNHGPHSFHSSDVSYNDYADSDEEEADRYDRDEDFRDYVSRTEVDEASDISGILAASQLNRLFRITADVDGATKKFRVKAQSPRVAREKLVAKFPNTKISSVEEITDLNELRENLRKWFKEKWVRFGPDGKIRGDCARGSESEGKPKCLPQSKAHSLGKKGRASAAARKRREDPNPERRGAAKNVATKVREQDVPEAFGLYGPFTATINTGERPQSRTKTKKFRREDDAILWAEDWLENAPQYVFATAEVTDPDGNVVWTTDERVDEKQDACYNKVRSRYKVWPSAYASGALVQCRKKGAANWGNKGKK